MSDRFEFSMLRSILQAAAAFALLSLGISSAVLSYDLHDLARHAEKSLSTLDAEIAQQNLNLSQDEMKLDAVLDQAQLAASEQRAYWSKTSADSDKTVKALRLAVDRASLLMQHTDEALNSSLIPDADRQLNLTAEAAQASLVSIDHASGALTFQIDALDLGPAAANLSESSARLANAMGSLQDASAHADNILAAGDRTAIYYENKLTTPASFARTLAETVLDIGAKVGSIFAGFVK
jgi:hypothetical protein